MPIYEYKCSKCETTQDKKFTLEEHTREKVLECSICGEETEHSTVIAPVGYANILTHGAGLSKAIRDGRISSDQVEREREVLRKRSFEYQKSKEGTERRMAQRERMEKRWNAHIPEKAFNLNAQK